jgi:hypothetical protein
MQGEIALEGVKLLTVPSYGLDRATGQRFLASCFLLFILRLLENEGIAIFVRALEILGRRIPADVAINA